MAETKIGKRGLPYVLPKQKALPYTPYDMSVLGATTPIVAPTKGLVKSTPEGRMALRNDEFNSYMGDSAGAYSQSPGYTQQSQQGLVQQSPIVEGSSGTTPWGVMNNAPLVSKNEALYSIGKEWGNMTPEQQAILSDRLTGLDTKELIGTDISKTSMPTTNWIDGMSNYEAMQGITGGIGLGLNAYGMLGSGGTMDVNKKNIELMNQQLANNRDLMATRQARAKDISGAFGPKTGLGA